MTAIDRFLDEPDALTESELADLAARLGHAPADARRIKDQLILHGLLTATLGRFRQDFQGRVAQRFADEELGQTFKARVLRRTRQEDAVRRKGRPPAGGRPLPSRVGELEREWRRAARGRRWGWWVGVLAASILVGVGLFRDETRRRLRALLGERAAPDVAYVAVLHAVSDGATVLSRNERIPATAGFRFRAGDALATDAGAGGAEVRYGADLARLRLAGGTHLVFSAPAGGAHVFLERGGLDVEVPRRAAAAGAVQAAAFGLLTPHASLQVPGTRFAVRAWREVTHVQMREGMVMARDRRTGRSLSLAAGEYGVIGAGTALVAGRRFRHRMTEGLQALYTFEEQAGDVVNDVAGGGTPLNLRIESQGAVRWLAGGGLAVDRPVVLTSEQPAAGLLAACRAADAISIEALIRPAVQTDVTGTPRIATCAAEPDIHHFWVGQADVSAAGGAHFVLCFGGSEWKVMSEPLVRPAELCHLVFTRDSARRTRCYVNGRDVTHPKLRRAHDLRDWNGTFGPEFSAWLPPYALALAGAARPDANGRRNWLGEYHLLAIYNRALEHAEVQRNFEACRVP
ncbi:MAG: FecR domain-containing protein [Kiritimatiellae bacterium]|nr:FecR domain-containing protein [Kiritimatiellia bacterium]